MQVLPARTATSPSLGCFLTRRALPAFSPASSPHPDGHLDSSAYIYCHPASLTASELLSHLASSSASMHLSLSRSAPPTPFFFSCRRACLQQLLSSCKIIAGHEQQWQPFKGTNHRMCVTYILLFIWFYKNSENLIHTFSEQEPYSFFSPRSSAAVKISRLIHCSTAKLSVAILLFISARMCECVFLLQGSERRGCDL